MPNSLVILGASVRAAAMSARRAGFEPLCGDIFADLDLRRIAPTAEVQDYPDGLEAVARAASPGPWIYTGGLENHPNLVDRIASVRPLLGNPGDVLRAARNPMLLASAFQAEGIPCPRVSLNTSEVTTDGVWLVKPLRGSGGSGIAFWRGQTDEDRSPEIPRSERYFQEWIEGEPCGAVYVAAAGKAVLLGVTRQLIGVDWLLASSFRYAGSIGPLQLSPSQLNQFRRIGDCLSRHFGLAGLFGVDAILSGETVWPIEANPRYPASTEVLERSLGFQAIRLHFDACRHGRLPENLPKCGAGVCGKAIVYASQDGRVSSAFSEMAERHLVDTPWPDLADIPRPDSSLHVGLPVTTVLAQADSEVSLVESLRSQAAEVERFLSQPCP